MALTKDFYSEPQYLISSRGEKITNVAKELYEKAVLSKSAALLPVYDNMVEHLKRLLPQTKIRLLTHCYDDEDFNPEESLPPKPDGIFRILWLGAVSSA